MNDIAAAAARAIGVVVIGRNEGERLRRCVESLAGVSDTLVYVDSGSTDDSLEIVRKLGADTVELDMSRPFSAARARNAGADRLRQNAPDITYIQFVDGDCEVVAGWLAHAYGFLEQNPDVAVVGGRRRERFPEASIYNLLCDLEWDAPVGEAAACGGDAIVRNRTLVEVGGYDPTVVAGEEPEMCYRFRQRGWRVYRLDHDMTLHDADMHRFSQWWMRGVRSGHAYAQGQAMHGGLFGGYCARNVWSILVWALVPPLLALGLAPITQGASLLALSAYGLLWWRIRKFHQETGSSRPGVASLYARYCVLEKFPQVVGVAKYWKTRLSGREARIIEYKGGPKEEV